jgi:asparagine synthase (glutamine-hydrolysing)
MCGIAGIYVSDGPAPSEEDVAAMLDRIVHRGPDDRGTYRDGPLAFGNQRLSILDLPGGHQPITNEDGSVVVVFNGEIYNYRELAAHLRARGHVLRTDSDTEVLVHLYEEFGDGCVSELRGMFAFAIWDVKRRRLLLARDRIGIKPLYWTDDGRCLLFGSEIKALLRHRSVEARIDLDALAAFMLLRYVPAPGTMFDSVHSLPPGHLLVCDERGVKISRWWDLSFNRTSPGPSEAEARAELLALLESAVSSHMVSDVPYGAFLSGGLDSSLVVALMAMRLGQPVRTFAVGYRGEGAAFDEARYARMVADRYETDHHEVLIGAGDLVTNAQRLIWHLDQPIADDACLPNFMVALLARDHVKMTLTGEGGDELFGGYARYAVERLAPFSTRAPGAARATARRLALRRPGRSRRQIATYALAEAGESARFAMYTVLMHPELRAELSTGALSEAVGRVKPSEPFAEPLDRTDATDPLNRALYVDTQHWLPDYLLARGDKTSMAASLEARVPLLDHPLVEFAASLPAKLKINGLKMTRKYLLREVARDLLPAPVLSRPKKGFPVPMSVWLRGGARDFCRDLLEPNLVRRRGLFSPQVVTRLVDEHQSRTADHGSLLWGLMSLELWHRSFLDHDGPGQSAPLRSSDA